MTSRKSSFAFSIASIVLLFILIVAVAAFAVLTRQPAPSTVQTVIPSQKKLMVWLADGVSPDSAEPNGQIGFLEGTFQPLLDVPQPSNRVMSCGTSADDARYAFYIGGDRGALYTMNAQESPKVLAAPIDGYVCTGSSGFKFAPNGAQVALIRYESDARISEFADGVLEAHTLDGGGEAFTTDNVTAFDINDDGMAFIRFYTNTRGEAEEAGVFWFEAGVETHVATLMPDESCRYTSASLGIAADKRFVAVLGHRCRSGNPRTSWQVHTIDPALGSATLAAWSFQPGAFVAYARTNNVLLSPQGDVAYFTTADGVVANTAALMRLDLSDLTTTSVLESGAVMATFADSANAAPVLSPDGRWLAVVVTDGEISLHAVDLSSRGEAAFVYPAARDVIAAAAFSPDSQHLYALIGSGEAEDGDYHLVRLSLTDGTRASLQRGAFRPPLLVNGTTALLMAYDTAGDPPRPYLNLVAVDHATNTMTTLFEGATLTNNRAENRRFAYPLAWR
jgi:hypothetical protein